MVENSRELATNRLLDIIRRGRLPSDVPPGALPDESVKIEPVVQRKGTTVEAARRRSAGKPTFEHIFKQAEPKSQVDIEAELISEAFKRSTKRLPAKKAKLSDLEIENLSLDFEIPDALKPVHERVINKIKGFVSGLKKPDKAKASKPAKVAKLKLPPLSKKVKGERIIGLDIGSSTIKFVELVQTKYDYSIVNLGIRNIPETALKDEKKLETISSKFIRDMLPANQIKNAQICLLLSDQSCQVRRIDLAPTESKNRINAIKFQINKGLPFPAEALDLTYRGWDSKLPGRQEIEVLAVDERDLKRRISLLDEIALAPVHITATPGIIRFLLDGYKNISVENEAVAVVDIGASKTTITIIEDGFVILCRTIATGGNDFTEVLEGATIGTEEEALNFERAEEHKIKVGFPREGEPETMRIAILMRPVAERISSEIARSIDFCRQELVKEELNKLVLIGGAVQMKRLPEFLAENLSLEIITGDPLARVDSHPLLSDENRDLLEKQGPAFLPALAIALDDTRQLNILPPELKVAVKFRIAKRMLPPVAAALTLIMLGLHFMAFNKLHSTESQYRILQNELPELATYRANYLTTKSEYDNLVEQFNQRKLDFTSIEEIDPKIHNHLHLISNIVPHHIYLDQLETKFMVEKVVAEKEESEEPELVEAGDLIPGVSLAGDSTTAVVEQIMEQSKPSYDSVLADLLDRKDEEKKDLMKRHIYGKTLVLSGTVYPQGSLTNVKLTDFIYTLESSGWFREVALDEITKHENGRLSFKIICGIG